MIFGFNTDVQGKDAVYHVQTEDRGHRNPVIESIIYVGGKILGKRRTSYDPATSSKEQIEEAVRHQHKELMEAIRTGTWTPPGAAAASSAPAQESPASGYAIELTNPTAIRQGDYLRFRLAVRDLGQNAAASQVALDARWLVAGADPEQQSLHARGDGGADLWFPAPEDHQQATLLICVEGPQGRQIAKFHVHPAA